MLPYQHRNLRFLSEEVYSQALKSILRFVFELYPRDGAFHGLVNFYKRIIRNFGGVSAPMTDCTRGKFFTWIKAAAVSFE